MLAYVFILFAFAVRFLPHPWHFTPVAAALLFFGAYRSRRQLWFPVALLAVSDVILTKYVYGYPFTWDHYITWMWYAGILLLGTRLHNNEKPLWIGASALASSVSFFLVSNFAVWACFDMYPKNFSGLLTSYTMGIPFFRNDVVGTLVFSAGFFAVPALLRLPAALRHKTAA